MTDLHLEFICGSIAPARSERTLATVVYTDIVGSTVRGGVRRRRAMESHPRQSRPHRVGGGEPPSGSDGEGNGRRIAVALRLARRHARLRA